jgi:hypothetical protein
MKTINNKLDRKAKIVLFLGLSPIILIFFSAICIAIINNNFGNEECRYKREYLNLDFTGIIISKDFEKHNKDFKYIEIMDSLKSTKKIYLFYQISKLWDKIEVGDEIKKRKGFLEFQILREGVSIRLETQFNCGEDDFWITSAKFKI